MELIFWACVLSLAYYPGNLGFIAWLGLIRPIGIIASLNGRAAFTSSYLFGFTFTACSIYWVAMVTPPGTVGAVLLVGLYYAIALWAFNRLYHWNRLLGKIALPFLWVGMEHYRTLTEFAFPWSDLGYTQSYYLYLIQIVSVISVHGLSLLIVAVNISLWQLFDKTMSPEKRLTSVLIPVALIAGLTAYGWAIIPPYLTEGEIKVAVLQGSITIEEKWAAGEKLQTFDVYQKIIDEIKAPDIDLYVWPETVLPCYLTRDRECEKAMRQLVRKTNSYHLVGTLSARRVNGELRHFNSCYQINPDGRIGPLQEKVKLVPFSEQVPYQNYLSFLRPQRIQEWLSFIKTYDVQWWSDFYPGDSTIIFETDKTSYGALICFESTFPEYSRMLINNGAKFLVGITNDTWFGESVGIYQHARIFVIRAIENRCWGVRSANSGLSFVVDDYGRLRDQLGPYVKGAIVVNISETDGRSVFSRVGDLAGKFSFLILTLTLGILVLSWSVRKLFG